MQEYSDLKTCFLWYRNLQDFFVFLVAIPWARFHRRTTIHAKLIDLQCIYRELKLEKNSLGQVRSFQWGYVSSKLGTSFQSFISFETLIILSTLRMEVHCLWNVMVSCYNRGGRKLLMCTSVEDVQTVFTYLWLVSFSLLKQ